MLGRMAGKYEHAKEWVKKNVTRYNYEGGVNIKYVAVGNEPFLTSYSGSFMKSTFPAVQNIQKALNEAGIGDKIKATIPLNADVYNSPSDDPMPSSGDFRADIQSLMKEIVHFLNEHNCPFMVNIYPFLSLYQNKNFPVDFAFFDGGSKPINDKGLSYLNCGVANRWYFINGLIKNLANNKGTPLKPGHIETYLFSLLDEDAKSILPGDFERHWGIFRFDGKPKFEMDLSCEGREKQLVGAKNVANNVDYACSLSDCTSLGFERSCGDLTSRGMSHMHSTSVFHQHLPCNFQGLAMMTTKNPAHDTCLFPIQIVSPNERVVAIAWLASAMALFLVLFGEF
ncbi:hypothetical protein AMTRI_Chr05g63300 [Amborella trichopoda]